MNGKTDPFVRARAFLSGEVLKLEEATALWQQLQSANQISTARAVLARIREAGSLLDPQSLSGTVRHKLLQQEAMLTSKDPELSSATRHDQAVALLSQEFDLNDPSFSDRETLGIAGGIYKRRWFELGQLADLRCAASFYERGAQAEKAKQDMGGDAYAHINAAFLYDLLAQAGDEPDKNRKEAAALRNSIVEKLPVVKDDWWNAATRAEALFGLGQYEGATTIIKGLKPPEAWKLEATTRQLATLAQLREEYPLRNPDIRTFFETLLPQSAEGVRSAFVGKVGLALSGGGFRASFYHLGVLARLAELDVLRHVEVLSCVSGGSIVGACYWLKLRQRLIDSAPLTRNSYVEMVKELIEHFQHAVGLDVRRSIQPSKMALAWRVLVKGAHGALDPEQVAAALERDFYRPLMPGTGTLEMHELPFTPKDHNPALAGTGEFNPVQHNWLRHDKVPVLILNATTVNTGHGWQFTPTWMGESPWAIHSAADSVPRLQWFWYQPDAGWYVSLGRAVAASASVPGVFSPLNLQAPYKDPELQVQLVDGGVYDNQGTVSLLASNCNVLLVSDAAGQLLLELQPATGLGGLGKYAVRSMDTLMERIRQANYGDLSARLMSGLLRGLMFVHMKAGLDADPIQLDFPTEAYTIRRSGLSPSGVRKEFQQALAELRTDLDAFSADESESLMALGYQMTAKAFARDLSKFKELSDGADTTTWSFGDKLTEITSTEASTPGRKTLLAALQAGKKVELG
jgi:predicted acylesterase/phospholipase RssA